MNASTHNAHDFLVAITIVLGVAAITTTLFQRLKQPVVLGYLIAGLLIGPHVPFPLVADANIVQTLSELGVILLMFSIGLEFNLRKLVKVGPTSGLTAIIQCSLMVWLGFVVGRAFGWTWLESIFTGAIIAISSTTIIAKAFDEQGVKGKLRETVVGVLIVEDLIAILLMAMLTALATPAGLTGTALLLTIGRLAAFLIGLVGIGLLIVPRAVRAINRLNRPETTLVASLGFCFGIALLARQFGYSVALGAFLAGTLIAESGEEKQIEHLVAPVKDMFAAIFFVSVGMLIDPALMLKHWPAIAVLIGVVIAGQIFSVTLGAFLTGSGTRLSLQAGMSLAQIGEFSFIIAALGISLKATGDFLYPIAVAVSAFTTLTTPWLIRASSPVANFVDRKLPHSIQTFATLYGTWVEKLRSAPRSDAPGASSRRMIGYLGLDAALLAGVVIGTSLSLGDISALLERSLGLGVGAARALVLASAAALALPFAAGILRLARGLGRKLAEAALPLRADSRLDLAAAPRRVLVVTLQLAIVLLVGVPLVAVTQPFLAGFPAAAVLLMLLAAFAFAFWRSATNLEEHVQAGAEMIVEALKTQSHSSAQPQTAPQSVALSLLLPGVGEPTTVRLEQQYPAVGKTLAQLNLRGLTGATVLAISRPGESVRLPTAQSVLRTGDTLALAGTVEAVAAALLALTGIQQANQ